jgi:hypothetical protein
VNADATKVVVLHLAKTALVLLLEGGE